MNKNCPAQNVSNNFIEKKEKARKKEARKELPIKLNQKLKSAAISFNLFGESFRWELTEGVYVLKGFSHNIGIIPDRGGLYKVLLVPDIGSKKVVADGLSFEFAFRTAEDLANKNKSLFTVSDRSAMWRDDPASEKQLKILRSKGYKSGLKELTKGQASNIIES